MKTDQTKNKVLFLIDWKSLTIITTDLVRNFKHFKSSDQLNSPKHFIVLLCIYHVSLIDTQTVLSTKKRGIKVLLACSILCYLSCCLLPTHYFATSIFIFKVWKNSYSKLYHKIMYEIIIILFIYIKARTNFFFKGSFFLRIPWETDLTKNTIHNNNNIIIIIFEELNTFICVSLKWKHLIQYGTYKLFIL